MDFSGWEKLSLVDYDDNITTTLFMAGCPFRCPWCHNSSLVLEPGKVGHIPWSEIMDYLSKRKNVLDAVCVTGGEPTMMPDLLDKLADIKSLGYKIKLDTNGSDPVQLRVAVEQGLVDYVAMDIKNCEARYPETVGVKNLNFAPVKESFTYLLTSPVRYEFRTTLVEEFHTKEDIEALGKMIRGAKVLYLQEFIDNENCIAHGFRTVPKEKALLYRAILLKYVERCELRGYD